MIELNKVDVTARSRAENRLFSGVDLALEGGEVAVISGASGSGKSTLFELIRGDLEPAHGTVSVLGRDLGKLRRSSKMHVRRLVGLVAQEVQLFEDLSALDNVALSLDVMGIARAEARVRAAEALASLDLACEIDARVSDLSGGERRRVCIARTLASEPMIVLFDQAADGLDSNGIDMLCALISELSERGVAILMADNHPQVLDVADRLGWAKYELRAGSLIEVGALDGVLCELEDESDEVPNVLPFPTSARIGVSE